MIHPSERSEATNRRLAVNSVALVVVGSVGWGLTEFTPDGSTLGAVGALLFLAGSILGMMWVHESVERLILWWDTRGYEVDR